MQDHQEMIENIPAYALGALDAGEAAILADHIANCAECQAELLQYHETADQLGLAAPDQVPSMRVKQELFSQIQTEIQAEPAFDRKSAGWRGWFSRRPTLGLVSVGLVLLLALGNLLLWNQVRGQTPAPFRILNLSATEVMPDAVGVLILSADGQYGTLVTNDLAPLSEEQQYQLLLIEDGARTSGGVFSVSDSGYAALRVYSKQPLDAYDGFGITIEPYGGSPGPTGDKVLGADY
jgi:anti-sigma-K factor RskA